VSDQDVRLGHSADNDGIDEYDNALPDWWQWLFVLTVVWGVGYLVDYHFLRPRSQVTLYEAEMARWPEPQRQVVSTDEASIAAGAELFAQTCASCHGADGSGGIGPSLVDTTWLHGGSPEQIRATIEAGVPAKGMPAWGPILGPEKIASLAAFVSTKAPSSGETGEVIFQKNCVACHGEHLEGRIGPNLTDAQWIHGDKLEDIERVITNGVPEKGMVSWGPILGPDRIKEVASFVYAKRQ
jgi:cytochrome c oxidase cbb3-type subunit 3